jgi:NTP pyrophosphatase (non-canonical NTP hydrolase)
MLKDVQKEVDEVLKPFAKPYWSPLSILARIAEEVGELARLLNHIYGDKPKKPTEAKQELGEEIMDVIFACVCLANREGIDLDAEFKKSLDKMRVRDKDRFAKKKSF